MPPHSQSNPTPSLRSAFSGPEWRQQANCRLTACQTKHVCSDACAGGRVADVGSQIKNPIAVMYVV